MYLELDLALYGAHGQFSVMNPRGPSPLSTMRLMLGYRPQKRFAFYAGPSFNFLVDVDPNVDADRPGYEYSILNVNTPSVVVRGWPGFAAGFEF